MNAAIVIAIVGAESTGKTTLARALAARLAEQTGLACTWVPEVLREWCEREGRTPSRDEQLAVAIAQQRSINLAAREHAVVVADTTALQTAVYSRLIFGDQSLDAMAVDAHRRSAATLLTALDLDWVSDGHQRDGPHVRVPVDDALRALMQRHRIAYSVVGGRGETRLEQALSAVTPLLAGRSPRHSGLFTRLRSRQDAEDRRRWRCDCGDPASCASPEAHVA